MSVSTSRAVLLLIVLSSLNIVVHAQLVMDPQIRDEIGRIKAIDNHAHPKRVLVKGENDEGSESAGAGTPMDIPVRLRPDNPEYLTAWTELYGSTTGRTSGVTIDSFVKAKEQIKADRGESYSVWILDRLNIDVMLANRFSMGRGLTSGRFRWVPFADALMYPLSNRSLGKVSPDHKFEFEGVDRKLRIYFSKRGLKTPPPTLDGYLNFVSATLQDWKRENAVAVKFTTAYKRTLEFDNVAQERARNVYSRFIKQGDPPSADYKALQDFLFRYIARESGRLGLAIHVHVGAGASGYFSQSGASPFLLESVLNDPSLRQTNFVLVHGGLPNAREARFLLYKPNVYADFSAQGFLTSTRELSETLRVWLEFVPEKVLFGTDAFDVMPEVGWEELAWLTNKNARDALAVALTSMMNDGQIDRPQAIKLARLVMRENAAKLYGLSVAP